MVNRARGETVTNLFGMFRTAFGEANLNLVILELDPPISQGIANGL